MDNTDKFINGDEVISITNKEENILINHPTYKVKELLNELSGHFPYKKMDKWISKGVSCEILSPNQNWQKGKIKICLQFIPDQPESVLDDIRKDIDSE